jgi:hypothetical protein
MYSTPPGRRTTPDLFSVDGTWMGTTHATWTGTPHAA